MKLTIPTYAIRMKIGVRRKTLSNYHFQLPKKRNKTICGIIVADGRGWKMRNKPTAWAYKYRQRWERKSIENIAPSKMCKTCLGAIIATK